jgi:hypothetical protein
MANLQIMLIFVLFINKIAAQPTLEHTYPFQVGRVATTDGNTRYLRTPYQSGSNWAIDIFDSNHQLLSSPVLDLPANGLTDKLKTLTLEKRKQFLVDLRDSNGFGQNKIGVVDDKIVEAWGVLSSSNDAVVSLLRTDLPTLNRFDQNFGANLNAVQQLKSRPDLLQTWVDWGNVLHRHYPGASNWPTIHVDDVFKANVRLNHGDAVGDMVDAVDNLNITNNAQVRGGIFHPSLPAPATNPIIAVNYYQSELVEGGIGQAFIDNLHPTLKRRVDYLQFLDDNNLISAHGNSVATAGRFGSHAEFRVLDRAIKDLEAIEGMAPGTFPESRLQEFTIFVKAKIGTNPPRCVCCWHGTHGVKMVGNE